MRRIPLALVALLAASAASAQPAPPNGGAAPPPPGIGPMTGGPDAAAPPPPPGGPKSPGGPRGDRPMPPPPPPRGASFHLAHGADGGVRLDVECAERDATKDCADIASQMLDKLNAVTRAK